MQKLQLTQILKLSLGLFLFQILSYSSASSSPSPAGITRPALAQNSALSVFEPEVVKKAFQTACTSGKSDSIRLLINDERITEAELREGFEHLPANVDDSILDIFLDDERLALSKSDASFAKDCFIKACSQKRVPMITSLLEKGRLDKDAVNQGYAVLPSMTISVETRYDPVHSGTWYNASEGLYINILFLNNGQLEPQFVGKILEEIFALGNNVFSHTFKNLKQSAVVLSEVTKAVVRLPIAKDRFKFIYSRGFVDIFDLDFDGIQKIIVILGEGARSYFSSLEDSLLSIIHPIYRRFDSAEYEARTPQLSLYLFQALQILVEETKENQKLSPQIKKLIKRMLEVYEHLKTLSNIPHLEIARSSLLMAPKSLVSSLNQIVKEFELEDSPINTYLQEVSRAKATIEDYFVDFEGFLENGFKGNKEMVLGMFFELYSGSAM